MQVISSDPPLIGLREITTVSAQCRRRRAQSWEAYRWNLQGRDIFRGSNILLASVVNPEVTATLSR